MFGMTRYHRRWRQMHREAHMKVNTMRVLVAAASMAAVLEALGAPLKWG
jgi:hypothetical protein